MTDRIITLTVALTEPVRDDDIEALAAAIRLFAGVAAVAKDVPDPAAFWARETALLELRAQLRAVLDPR
jgi:hypothetical protein